MNARIYLTGCALAGQAQQHRAGTNNASATAVEAVALADATLKALRIGSKRKTRKVSR